MSADRPADPPKPADSGQPAAASTASPSAPPAQSAVNPPAGPQIQGAVNPSVESQAQPLTTAEPQSQQPPINPAGATSSPAQEIKPAAATEFTSEAVKTADAKQVEEARILLQIQEKNEQEFRKLAQEVDAFLAIYINSSPQNAAFAKDAIIDKIRILHGAAAAVGQSYVTESLREVERKAHADLELLIRIDNANNFTDQSSVGRQSFRVMQDSYQRELDYLGFKRFERQYDPIVVNKIQQAITTMGERFGKIQEQHEERIERQQQSRQGVPPNPNRTVQSVAPVDSKQDVAPTTTAPKQETAGSFGNPTYYVAPTTPSSDATSSKTTTPEPLKIETLQSKLQQESADLTTPKINSTTATPPPIREARREPALATVVILNDPKDAENFNLKQDSLHIVLTAQQAKKGFFSRVLDEFKNLFGFNQDKNITSEQCTGKNGSTCLVVVLPKQQLDKILPGLLKEESLGLKEVSALKNLAASENDQPKKPKA